MVTAIIVAGGHGVRMQHSLRKQYIKISGIPVLGHTLAVFDACDSVDNIILVVPGDDTDTCRQTVISPLRLKKDIRLIEGGEERCHSVYNGLTAVDRHTRFVVIHDGVRPFVHPDQIRACIEKAKTSGACILGVSVTDTVKSVDASMTIQKTLGREDLQLAQTPQAFQYDLIMRAHNQAKADGFISSDDAQLVERLGEKVSMIPGSRLNIKITEKEDLKLAEFLLKGTS